MSRRTTHCSIPMTRDLAHAAGWDAGNRSMREAGRTVWNEDDYNAAARCTNALMAVSSIQSPSLYIEVLGRRYPVASLAEASRMFCAARDRWGRGGSQTPEAFIVDESGERVGRISYNGRVWPPQAWTPDMVPLYDNRQQEG